MTLRTKATAFQFRLALMRDAKSNTLLSCRLNETQGRQRYLRRIKMTTAAMLMREIETLPEESMSEALDFIVFLKNKSFEVCKSKRISTKNARGIFKDLKGMDTTIEREDADRV
jgi:hypothetical protein